MNINGKLLTAIITVVAGTMLYGADVSDDLPVSVVQWVCPDEPFAEGIGKPRYYRKTLRARSLSMARRCPIPPCLSIRLPT